MKKNKIQQSNIHYIMTRLYMNIYDILIFLNSRGHVTAFVHFITTFGVTFDWSPILEMFNIVESRAIQNRNDLYNDRGYHV